MSKSFLPMIATVAGSVLAYFLVSTVLGLSEIIGLFAGISTSIILSGLFTKLKK